MYSLYICTYRERGMETHIHTQKVVRITFGQYYTCNNTIKESIINICITLMDFHWVGHHPCNHSVGHKLNIVHIFLTLGAWPPWWNTSVTTSTICYFQRHHLKTFVHVMGHGMVLMVIGWTKNTWDSSHGN